MIPVAQVLTQLMHLTTPVLAKTLNTRACIGSIFDPLSVENEYDGHQSLKDACSGSRRASFWRYCTRRVDILLSFWELLLRLFVIYTMDMLTVVRNCLGNYADDSTVFATILQYTQRLTIAENLNADLARIN